VSVTSARLEKVNPRVFVRDSKGMFYDFLILQMINWVSNWCYCS